jgi:hypothetical protein
MDTLLTSSSFSISDMVMFLVAVIYLVGHALLLFYQLTALNVAVNSYTNVLFPLLLSNQFYEVKSSVFKRFEKENLFQLACGDAVERFELGIMLIIIIMRNSFELSLTFSWELLVNYIVMSMVIVYLSECIADWMKHIFIAKFNHIRPEMYLIYRHRLYQDWQSMQHLLPIYRSGRIARRMGCVPYALVCLVIRSLLQVLQTSSSSWYWTIIALCGILLGAYLLKWLTSCLLFYGYSQATTSLLSTTIQEDIASLSSIDRYTLFKGRIP